MKKLYMLMFTLLVSSKGFCAADEEMAGARATAASAKSIEDPETYMMLGYQEEISPLPASIQKEEIGEYMTHMQLSFL